VTRPTIELWWIDLDAAARTESALGGVLTPDERARASRMVRPGSRAAFVITRGMLRRLLARRLGEEAASLRFAYGRYGKPWLPVHPQLSFNVAHSAGRAVIAISHAGPVGVDIERVDPAVDIELLIPRCFSVPEAAVLASLSGPARRRAFFDGWARKEALVKALGVGLCADLAQVPVSLAPGAPARLLGSAARAWNLTELAAGGDYAAALVVPRGCHAVVTASPAMDGGVAVGADGEGGIRTPDGRKRPYRFSRLVCTGRRAREIGR
jgi:4'-phosphopantetheinyl transferase